jgi:diacylglycerol kinase family enzyme
MGDTETVMTAILIFNSRAGRAAITSAEELVADLAHAGFRPIYRPTETESDLEQALREDGDVVIAAGGDGTVRAVAQRVAARRLPLAIIPLGTANNVGAALGLNGMTPAQIIAGLRMPRRRPPDVGVVESPSGRSRRRRGSCRATRRDRSAWPLTVLRSAAGICWSRS